MQPASRRSVAEDGPRGGATISAGPHISAARGMGRRPVPTRPDPSRSGPLTRSACARQAVARRTDPWPDPPLPGCCGRAGGPCDALTIVHWPFRPFRPFRVSPGRRRPAGAPGPARHSESIRVLPVRAPLGNPSQSDQKRGRRHPRS
jgi:hypothetical protein